MTDWCGTEGHGLHVHAIGIIVVRVYTGDFEIDVNTAFK